MIEDVIRSYEASDFEYVANVTTEYSEADPALAKFPIGIRVQAIAPEAIARAAREADDAYYREHSTSYIYENPESFRVGYFEARGRWEELNRPQLTFAVNYRENFELVSQIFEELYPADPNFSLHEAVRFFDENPQLHPLMGAQES